MEEYRERKTLEQTMLYVHTIYVLIPWDYVCIYITCIQHNKYRLVCTVLRHAHNVGRLCQGGGSGKYQSTNNSTETKYVQTAVKICIHTYYR